MPCSAFPWPPAAAGPAPSPGRCESAALRADASDPRIRAFYEARQWQAAWDSKSEKALLDIIAEAPANGLKPDLFLKGRLPADANAREQL